MRGQLQMSFVAIVFSAEMENSNGSGNVSGSSCSSYVFDVFDSSARLVNYKSISW